jgi:hypothetical protein
LVAAPKPLSVTVVEYVLMVLPIKAATSTADPSGFHAIDLSSWSSVPKIDHVAPPSVETKNGLAPLLLKSKAPANICMGSTGLTAMLARSFDQRPGCRSPE